MDLINTLVIFIRYDTLVDHSWDNFHGDKMDDCAELKSPQSNCEYINYILQSNWEYTLIIQSMLISTFMWISTFCVTEHYGVW